jgi:hypothetical protein
LVCRLDLSPRTHRSCAAPSRTTLRARSSATSQSHRCFPWLRAKRHSLSAPRCHPTSVPVVLPSLHHGSAIETRGIPAAWRARGHPAWCGLATYAAKGVSNSAGQVTLVRIARLGPVGIVVGLLVLGMLAALTVYCCSDLPWSEWPPLVSSLLVRRSRFSCAEHFRGSRRRM